MSEKQRYLNAAIILRAIAHCGPIFPRCVFVIVVILGYPQFLDGSIDDCVS